MEQVGATKQCSKCDRVLPSTDFYKNRRECKDCLSRRSHARYIENHEKMKPHRAMYARNRHANNPEARYKDKVRTVVYRAVKKGILTKQACWCGSPDTKAYHYKGYEYPLAVEWLCREHHILSRRYVPGMAPNNDDKHSLTLTECEALLFPRGHGMYGTSEYYSWQAMKARCFNDKTAWYEYYGGRGITVCERWRKSFKAFYEDMGDKPSPKHSIDRKDNDGHYSCGKCDECKRNGWPMNCKWSTSAEQAINKRPRIHSIPKMSRQRISGVLGVDFVSRINKWRARIGVNNKGITLGYYNSVEDAIKARKEGEKKYYGRV